MSDANKPSKISDLLTLSDLDGLDEIALPPEVQARLEAAIAQRKAAEEAKEKEKKSRGGRPRERGKARDPSANPYQSRKEKEPIVMDEYEPPPGAPVVEGVAYIPARSVIVRKGTRGPIPSKLTSEQMMRIVGFLQRMMGRAMACQELGINYGKFENEFRLNPAFRTAVRAAEQAAYENLDLKGFDMALSGNQDVLFKMWDRRAKSKMLDRTWELSKAELQLKREALEKGMNPTGGYSPPSVDMSAALADATTDQVAAFRKVMGDLQRIEKKADGPDPDESKPSDPIK